MGLYRSDPRQIIVSPDGRDVYLGLRYGLATGLTDDGRCDNCVLGNGRAAGSLVHWRRTRDAAGEFHLVGPAYECSGQVRWQRRLSARCRFGILSGVGLGPTLRRLAGTGDGTTIHDLTPAGAPRMSLDEGAACRVIAMC